MIPKNKHRLVRMDRLKLFDGDDHPYKDNLIAFADENPDMRNKLAELEKNEKNRAELRKVFISSTISHNFQVYRVNRIIER